MIGGILIGGRSLAPSLAMPMCLQDVFYSYNIAYINLDVIIFAAVMIDSG